MDRVYRAIFHDGAFVPTETPDLPPDSEVELIVRTPPIAGPVVTDPIERERIVQRMIARMLQNPLPKDAPRFTRDELHERR
jgi:hypothetical protein